MGLFEQIVGRLPLNVSNALGSAVSHLSRYEAFSNYLRKKNAKLLHRLGEIKKVLVISDVNIGDAVTIQSCIEALRSQLPDSEIDYAYSLTADPIINRNPEISNTFPIFKSSIRPSELDRIAAERLCREKGYDLVVDLCPLLPSQNLRRAGRAVVSPLGLIAEILNAKTREDRTAHLAYRINRYMNTLLSEVRQKTQSKESGRSYSGPKIYLSSEVLAARNQYLRNFGISPDDVIVYFNPDTSNRYTFLDKRLQRILLRRLLLCDSFDFLVLGYGTTFDGIERDIFADIPVPLRDRVVAFNRKVSLDIFASILDVCSVFITGDTGPMHIAAARKICVDNAIHFRNRTAIVSIFGPTDPEVYGYDSFDHRYAEANQDAPSKIFEATPSCKNITCSIQRLTNQCTKGRCFEGINIDAIVAYVATYLSSSKA
jgi:ADP-heptose:LPS heptosyltransferase